jgi:hypothetical protein
MYFRNTTQRKMKRNQFLSHISQEWKVSKKSPLIESDASVPTKVTLARATAAKAILTKGAPPNHHA